MSRQLAQTILGQLGGNKFLAITGAKGLTALDNGFAFRLPRNAKDGINYVRITLNSLDLYNMEFLSIWRQRNKVIKEVPGLYNDQLQEIFTHYTGLNTSL